MKKICGVTMVGVIDMVGEFGSRESTGPNGEDFREFQHPYFLQVQVDQNGRRTNAAQLVPMIKGSNILGGSSIMLNMKNVLWLFEPTKAVTDEYTSARTGIVPVASFRDKAVNQ